MVMLCGDLLPAVTHHMASQSLVICDRAPNHIHMHLQLSVRTQHGWLFYCVPIVLLTRKRDHVPKHLVEVSQLGVISKEKIETESEKRITTPTNKYMYKAKMSVIYICFLIVHRFKWYRTMLRNLNYSSLIWLKNLMHRMQAWQNGPNYVTFVY